MANQSDMDRLPAVAGQVQVLGPGDMCYFPKNTDHAVTRISEEPLKVLVIYAPPKG